jgi:iron complex outermembrane recepter protein
MRARYLLIACLGLASPAALAADATPEIVIVGTTPLSGSGVPLDWLPSNVQTYGGDGIAESQALSFAEFLVRGAPGVSLNEIQGNPFQPDLNFRGFTASPLLGTPQGLSVFVDGVRVNEPFGDTVNWDFVIDGALAGADLLPGSSPAFGLNTLGGALVLRTKSGLTWQGTSAELSGGSFGRRRAEIEHGGRSGNFGWYVAADRYDETGWRDFSESDATRAFAKLSHGTDTAEWSLALTQVDSALTGNGLLPLTMLAQRRDQVFTHPDTTLNRLAQAVVEGRLQLGERSSLTLSAYHRQQRARTLNGDGNDDFEDGPFDGVSNEDSGVYNRTRTRQQGDGAAAQWNLRFAAGHQLSLGASFDVARVRFAQTAEEGVLDPTRGVGDLEDPEDENALRGRTRTASLYASGTLVVAPTVQLTASARYNASRVETEDLLVLEPPNLDGDHRYTKLNPALGVTWQVSPQVTAYAGASQASRVPTPIELGCADPENPCTLPNSLAADPYLKQVVARTLEAGLRGRLGGLRWHAGAFRTGNRDDILFIGTSTSAGYFTNFGRTRREGVELSVAGQWQALDWQVQYSHLRAQFRDAACLLAENNSTRGTDPACTAGGQDDEIRVNAGDRLPGLPAHLAKASLAWQARPWLRLTAEVQGASRQYARGNENNAHEAGTVTDAFDEERTFLGAGTVPGHVVAGLLAEARLADAWTLSLQVSNLFNRRYATAAALAENPFAADGSFNIDSEDWQRETFVGPGAPRAAWLGVRYTFGR